jgi:glutathione S-transferase
MPGVPVQIIGSYLSPYVRKVLVCLDLKGIAYEIDPIVPFFGDDAFTRLSPLRRIPVLRDGALTIADSSVICEYLEERWPRPALFPVQGAQRARARWLEEYADTRLGEVFIRRLFYERVIKPAIWKLPCDEARVRQTLERDAPEVLDYLEGELPGDGCLFGQACVADVAIAAFFRNARFASFSIDAGRWPRAAAFVARLLEHPAFLRLRPFEELLMRTSIARHRDALHAAGAPLTAETFGSATPRPGMRAF